MGGVGVSGNEFHPLRVERVTMIVKQNKRKRMSVLDAIFSS